MVEQTDLQFEIMEDIACGAPLATVWEKLIRLVEAQIPGAACSLYLLDEAGLYLTLAMGPNLPEGFNQVLKKFRISPQAGSCGTAAFHGKTVLVADASQDELWSDHRDLVLKYGIKACWSTPILSQRLSFSDGSRRVLGTFAVYPDRCGLPDEKFMSLMLRAQHLACLALETDRIKRTETLLSRQSRLLLKAQSMAALGCFEWDIRSGDLTWSDNLYDIYGVDRQTFIPKVDTFLSMVHPDDREQLRETVEKAIATSSSFRTEERIVRPNGSIRILETFAQVECDEDGSPALLIGACYDVTDRRRMENHLAESQKMEAVGRLAGGLAHDFNNLLTVINGNAALLQGSLFSQQDREAVSEISEAGHRAAELTAQLLAFSRGLPVEPTVVDFNQVVRDCLKWMKRLVGERVEVQLELEPTEFRLEIDLRQLEQLLMNLVLNARDAMSSGGLLRVVTRSRTGGEAPLPSGPCVELLIQDSGSGIPADVIPNIFEPFFSTKEQGRGTGLGLAVVHGVVTRWSGHIEVASKPDEGTSFTIVLPLTQKPMVLATSTQTSSPDPSKATILVVEDEPSVRRLVVRLLKANGFTVHVAEHAKAALQMFAGHHFDALLTDLVMPGMGGRELAEKLRKSHPGLPVLFTSGYSDDLMDLEIEGSGPVSFLKKPFSAVDLPTRLQDLLKMAGSTAQRR